MTERTRTMALGVALLGMLALLPTRAGSVPGGSEAVRGGGKAPEVRFAPGEVLVKFRDDSLASAFEARGLSGLQRESGLTALLRRNRVSQGVRLFRGLRDRRLSGIVKLVSPVLRNDPAGTEALIRELRARPEVEYAEPNVVMRAAWLPDDPYLSSAGSWGQAFDDLWGLHLIDAPAAWDASRGDGVVVAVLDTGVDNAHPDLTANVWLNPGETGLDAEGQDKRTNGIDDDLSGYVDDWRGWDFISYDNDPTDDHGHGTHVAGTVAAVGNNALGVVGVAPSARIMPVKVLDYQGTGYVDQISAGIVYAALRGARVLNLSLTGSGETPRTLVNAVNIAHSRGVVVVGAAGNWAVDVGSPLEGEYPANLRDVIAVAASRSDDELASFSNHGAKIDLAAPGGGDVDAGGTVYRPDRSILSLRAAGATSSFTDTGQLTVGGDYARQSGTSMSAPHVAGAAALVLAQHPEYSPEQVRQVLRRSAVDLPPAGFDTGAGYGRLDVGAAMAQPTPLAVQLTDPLESFSARDTVVVEGTADGPALAEWVLEYGAGPTPEEWTTVASGTSPVLDGPIAAWSPSVVPDGPNTLRLQARDVYDNVFEDRMMVTVDSVTIDTPAPSPEAVVGQGGTLELSGTVEPAGFVSYTLQITGARTGLLANPVVTLADGGTQPVSLGPLGTWDTRGVPADHYQVCVMTTLDTGVGPQQCVQVLVDPAMHAGWPLNLGYSWWRPSQHLTAYDLDGDGASELLVAFGGSLRVLTHDGSALAGWPQPVGGELLHGPAVGDVDGDGLPEVVVGDNAGDVYVWEAGGALKVGWPQRLFAGHAWVTVADLDGDGRAEIVAADSNYAAGGSQVVVVSGDGTILPGWPRDPGLDRMASLSVGDVDGDGAVEIVAASRVTPVRLAVLETDGTLAPGWPLLVDPSEPAGQWVDSYPALADLDQDGDLEIILGTKGGMATVLRGDGTTLPGWPQVVEDMLFNSPAVGDLDGDGLEDVVMGGRTYYRFNDLYAWSPDGTLFPGWPMWPPYSDGTISFFGYGAPVIGDVDGDGALEAVVSSDSAFTAPFALQAHKATWAWPDGFPRPTRGLGTGPDDAAAIADLDGDGLLELAWIDNNNDLFVWDLAAPVSAPRPWPMFHHDAAHTGARVTAGVSALYDDTLLAPRCSGVRASCDSGSLLRGRGPLGPEPHAPNTILSSCADGTAGTFHVDESSDRILVSTLDGTPFAPGKTVRVDVNVWAYSSYTSDVLDLFHAANATAPVWIPLASIAAQGPGAQVLSTTYVLPEGSLQAVRAQFRFGGASGSPCQEASYNDQDDLVFEVSPPSVPLQVWIQSDEGGRGTVALSPDPVAGQPVCDNLASGSSESCVVEYTAGTMVSLVAQAEPDSGFVGWEGACFGTGDCTVPLDQAREVGATFLGPRELKVWLSSPEGGSGRILLSPEPLEGAPPECVVSGSSGPSVCSFRYPPGTVVSLLPESQPDSKFMGWDFGCTGTGPCDLALGQTRLSEVGATFLGPREMRVRVSSLEGGRGRVLLSPPPLWDALPVCEAGPSELTECYFAYPPDAVVSAIVETEPDSKFMGWDAACTGAGPCDIELGETSGWDLGAAFLGPREMRVRVSSAEGGRGRVLLSPPPLWDALPVCEARPSELTECYFAYPPDTVVSAIVETEPDSKFMSWDTACAGAGPCDIELGEASGWDLGATFLGPRQMRVRVSSAEGGRGRVLLSPPPLWDALPVCEGGPSELTECYFAYPPDTVVSAIVETEPDSKFMGWDTACTGSGPCDIELGETNGWDLGATFLGPRELTLTLSGSYGGLGQIDLAPAAVGGETACALPAGSDVTTCGLLYPPDAEVTLSAMPDVGSAFLGWSGACTGVDGCALVMTEAAAVGALFEVPNVPPAVSLDSPSPGAVLTAPATIALAATAEDVDGGIVQVEFFQGAISLGVDTEPPYETTWSDVPAGVYSLSARATDARGGVSMSPPVAVSVETRLEATADTYIVTSSLRIRRNHGSDQTLRVREAGARLSYWTYIKFDTSSVPDGSRVRIRLRGGQSPTSSSLLRTSAFPVYDTSWDERGLAWDNRPDSGETALDSVTLASSVPEAWYEWDVTDHVLQERAIGRDVVSFVLKNEDASRESAWFWSREALSNQPELVITP